MLDDAVVVDAVVHAYNLTPANRNPDTPAEPCLVYLACERAPARRSTPSRR